MVKYKIFFSPEKKEIITDGKTNLYQIATDAGIYITSGCAGEGNCGRCKVIVRQGKYRTQPSRFISEKEKKEGYLLACQTYPESDLEILIPPGSGLKKWTLIKDGVYTAEELIWRGNYLKWEFSPLAKKIYLELPAPTLTDHLSDFERLVRELKSRKDLHLRDPGIKITLPKLQKLAQFLRENQWKLTLTLADNGEIIDYEPGDMTAGSYGLALDIGTTTVALSLIDLNKNEVLGAKATYNQQMSFGDDVISRIIYAENETGGLEKLNRVVRETVNWLISELVKEKGIENKDILALEVAGNTTMNHLFLSLPPGYIRKEPYLPTANFLPDLKGKEIGINIHSEGIVSFCPNVSSYIGGDVTAGILASGMDEKGEISLLIDLGTNGEMVLGNKDFLISAACSAGPAFEGVGIKSGIRAMEGAVENIQISADGKKVKYTTIGNKPPAGICGSGLVDAVAELFKDGFLDRKGKFILESSSLIRESEEGKEFLLVPGKETVNKKDIVLSEADISTLIRSKGAIYLGASVLLEEMGYQFSDLKKIYLAGMFGTYLDIEKAIIIGLLPDLPRTFVQDNNATYEMSEQKLPEFSQTKVRGLAREKFVFLGNSAISGAKLCLLYGEARNKVREIAKKTTYLELSVNPKFMNEYSATLFLPHTNIDLFPSVKKLLNI
jgi:uncharacterized 2Fe-2S/4Fe-4S cluster protein (DUF4445 family)